MRLMLRFFLPLLAVVSLAACRQADGPVPAPSEGRQAELGDISRDILNIASGRDPAGPKDLADDLRRYADDRQNATPAVDELSRRAAGALTGKNVSEDAAQQLAHHFWVAISARELSERQIEGLQNDVQSVLGTVGVNEQQASSVAEQIGAVQDVATDRTRRWYEWF